MIYFKVLIIITQIINIIIYYSNVNIKIMLKNNWVHGFSLRTDIANLCLGPEPKTDLTPGPGPGRLCPTLLSLNPSTTAKPFCLR